MKKWIVFSVCLLILLLLLPLIDAYTGTDQPVSNVTALEAQIYDDYIEQYYPDTYPHERPSDLYMFRYFATDNGYHIISWGGMLCDVKDVKIAGYSFGGSSDTKLMAYKNGKFFDLKTAYLLGLVSKDGIARAYEAKYPYGSPEGIDLTPEEEYIDQFGPVDVFRNYMTEFGNGYAIVYVVDENASCAENTITIAGVNFKCQREGSLYAYKGGRFYALEDHYEMGIVGKTAIVCASWFHAVYELIDG